MLFKRVLVGDGDLTAGGRSQKSSAPLKQDSDTWSDCADVGFVEEIMRILLLTILLWAGISYGGVIMPFSFNLIPPTMYPPPTYDYPFPDAGILKKLPAIKEKHLNDSIMFGQRSTDMLERLETNLRSSQIHTELGSAGHGQLIAGYPTEEASGLHQLSSIITKASYQLSHFHCGRFGVPDDECASYISTLSLRNTDLGRKCLDFQHKKCSDSKKYRSYDGSCNNLKRSSWGQALTGFKRLLHPKYADGIEKPRRSVTKNVLPSPREISSTIAVDINMPDNKHTLALMQWTEFLEHDLIHIPIRKMIHSDNSITCCDGSGGMLSPRYQHPSCLPLSVPRKDPFYGQHWVSCLTYTRSVTTFRSDCTFGAAEQMNQATHYLDGSHIYGSSAKEAKRLRTNSGGFMKVEELPDGTFLPLVEKSKRREKCQLDDSDDTCFLSGNVRVNTHPHLTSMHTVWLREHNRIARNLAELNPTWGDEMLYQETRRIVIAQLQHITYAQWLPALLGTSYDDNIDPYDISYNADLDPSITNSLATAGIRFFNSLIDGNFNLLNEDRSVNETIELVDHYNRPAIVKQKGKLTELLRGMTSQPSQSMDLHFADDVLQQLYSPKGKRLGLDILSLDIQRGREHGIPPYHQFREMCGLNSVLDFDDFSDSVPEKIIDEWKKLYSHAFDVDLIIGALSEQPQNGMLLGPTFSCLLREQLHRTRSADRYFYTNIDQPEPFTQQQLQQIRKTSLARIICDNVPEIESIQRNVFRIIDSDNELVPCKGAGVKRVNLAAWQDAQHKPNLITRTKRNVDKWIKA